MNHKQIKEGITIIEVKIKKVPQSPFSQSTRAPEDEARVVVDWLNGDWGTFFILTALMVIPSLVCLWFMRHKIKIGAK